jgi:hypothetical protein
MALFSPPFSFNVIVGLSQKSKLVIASEAKQSHNSCIHKRLLRDFVPRNDLLIGFWGSPTC